MPASLLIISQRPHHHQFFQASRSLASKFRVYRTASVKGEALIRSRKLSRAAASFRKIICQLNRKLDVMLHILGDELIQLKGCGES